MHTQKMAMFKRIFSVGAITNNFNFLLPRYQIVCQSCATIKYRAIEKKLGIPPKPKRPFTPYIAFTMAERQGIKEANPGITNNEILKLLGEKWRKVDPAKKEALERAYKIEVEEYTKKMMKYEGSLTDEQRTLLQNERHRQIEADEKTKMKSRLQELGRPKRPATTFILYMLSKLDTKNKDIGFSEWLTEVGKEWTVLPSEEKAKYEMESKKLMEQYKADMIRWEEKMIKMGHIDVVRRQVLLDLKGKGVPQ